jgi:hypothetical protein
VMTGTMRKPCERCASMRRLKPGQQRRRVQKCGICAKTRHGLRKPGLAVGQNQNVSAARRKDGLDCRGVPVFSNCRRVHPAQIASQAIPAPKPAPGRFLPWTVVPVGLSVFCVIYACEGVLPLAKHSTLRDTEEGPTRETP